MRHYSSLFDQTGRLTTATRFVGSSVCGSQIVVFVITLGHLLAFQSLVTAFIPISLVVLTAISIGVSPQATGSSDLIVIAAAASPGPVTMILISAATAASQILGNSCRCCSQIWVRLTFCELDVGVQVHVGCIGFACTKNPWLVTIDFVVHFYLPSPESNIDRVEN